jgi:D-arabinose 1-dehydrogenase-like Zn-dependent alcohol dehydrogenase
MAVKQAAAMGAEVTVLSTSDRKKADAERMGARHFLINSDKTAMKAAAVASIAVTAFRKSSNATRSYWCR